MSTPAIASFWLDVRFSIRNKFILVKPKKGTLSDCKNIEEIGKGRIVNEWVVLEKKFNEGEI